MTTPSERLNAMLDILACPVTGSMLTLEGDALVSVEGGHRYPVVNGIPMLHPNVIKPSPEKAPEPTDPIP
ncbi:MAG TPA: Trm112 family protein [Kiritimatiellia bacterium]|nr:Trm112 family protein [Kiritimatiellia bacterium]